MGQARLSYRSDGQQAILMGQARVFCRSDGQQAILMGQARISCCSDRHRVSCHFDGTSRSDGTSHSDGTSYSFLHKIQKLTDLCNAPFLP